MTRRLAAALALALLAPAAPARADILVGIAGPMSGSFAPIGEEIRSGVEAAVADINAAGGLAGETLSTVVVDDRCEAETGAAVANQLVGKGATLVVGHACTAAALPAAKVYAAHGIVLISPAATNPRFTDEAVGPGVFRLAPRSDREADAIADRLVSVYGDKRVAFVHDGSVYGQALVEAARKLYEQSGAKAVTTETFTPGEKSQITLAGRLQDAAVSAVVMGALQADAAVIATEVRSRGLGAELIGSEAVGLAEFKALAGDAAEGVVFAAPRDVRREPGAAALVERLRAAGGDPGRTTVLAYAAVQAWAAAAEAGREVAAVAARLRTGGVPTVIGPVRFDAKGDLTENLWSLYVWHGDTPVPVP